jgi:hypothetical protein
MHINDIQTARSVSGAPTENIELNRIPRPRSRAHSLDPTTDLRSRSLLERMKLTHEFRVKCFKGNIRREHIHGPFTTLEEMLHTLPEPLGIDIKLSNNIPLQPDVLIELMPTDNRIPNALGS